MSLAGSLLMVFQPSLTTIDTLTLDANLSETHQQENDVTSYPVEEGADITDHAQPKPKTVTIEGVVTDTPLSQAALLSRIGAIPSTLAGAPVALFGPTGPVAGLLAGNLPSSPDYVKLAYEQLEGLFEQRKIITVVTTLRTYKSMMITSLTIPRDFHTGNALKFTAVLRQIRIVKTKRVALANTPAAPKVPKGAKPNVPATTAEQNISILQKAHYWIMGTGVQK